MKNFYTTLFVFLLVHIQIVSSQTTYSGKIYYTIKLKAPKPNQHKEIIKEGTSQKITELIRNASDVESILIFKGTEALYKLFEKMDNDANRGINLTKILGGNNDIFYYNYLNNELVKQTTLLGESLIVDIKKPTWKITQQTKFIGGYNCFMAIDEGSDNKKAKPIVWFTNQLPVSFGPKEYVGLPGLILEVETTSFIITTNKIILNPKNNVKIKKPDKGRKISYEEFNKLLKKSVPDLFSK